MSRNLRSKNRDRISQYSHAVDCVENITTGDFPDMILKAHQQYLKGYNAANDSGNSMCPIGQNTTFCRGWDDNNDDYGNSDCEDALTNKGVALGNLGNHTSAILYYDKVLAIDPKYENALYNKGYDLAALGNYTEAILYYDKALAINPNDTYALENKGYDLAALGNYTEAIEFYNKTLAIDPHDVDALNNKGVVRECSAYLTCGQSFDYIRLREIWR